VSEKKIKGAGLAVECAGEWGVRDAKEKNVCA